MRDNRELSPRAKAALDAYPWKVPAERDRALYEASLVSFGERIEFDELPLKVRQYSLRRSRKISAKDAVEQFVWNGEGLEDLVSGFERRIIEQALEACKWNLKATARQLNCTYRVLRYKVGKLGLAEEKEIS